MRHITYRLRSEPSCCKRRPSGVSQSEAVRAAKAPAPLHVGEGASPRSVVAAVMLAVVVAAVVMTPIVETVLVVVLEGPNDARMFATMTSPAPASSGFSREPLSDLNHWDAS